MREAGGRQGGRRGGRDWRGQHGDRVRTSYETNEKGDEEGGWEGNAEEMTDIKEEWEGGRKVGRDAGKPRKKGGTNIGVKQESMGDGWEGGSEALSEERRE